MLLWNLAILAGGAARVSLLLYLEPAVSVAGAVIFLGERVGMATIAGGLLIVAGVGISSTARFTGPQKDERQKAHEHGASGGG